MAVKYSVSLYDVIERKEYVLHDTNTLDLLLKDVKASLIENQCGSISFKILENHPYYNKVVKRSVRIMLYDGHNNGAPFFVGRPTKISIDIDNIKTVTCEGELNYLKDLIYQDSFGPFNTSTYQGILYLKSQYSLSLRGDYINDLGLNYIWHKGISTWMNEIPKDNTYVYDFKKGTTIFDALEKILNNDYVFKFNYYYVSGDLCRGLYIAPKTYYKGNQTIEFGKNLISFTKEPSDNYANAVIPTGKDGLNIASVNTTPINQYRTKTYVDVDEVNKTQDIVMIEYNNDAITDANILLSQAKYYLKQHQKVKTKIKINAVDMALTQDEEEPFVLSTNYKVVSIPNGINQYMRMTRIDVDISNPRNNKYTLESEESEVL